MTSPQIQPKRIIQAIIFGNWDHECRFCRDTLVEFYWVMMYEINIQYYMSQ